MYYRVFLPPTPCAAFLSAFCNYDPKAPLLYNWDSLHNEFHFTDRTGAFGQEGRGCGGLLGVTGERLT